MHRSTPEFKSICQHLGHFLQAADGPIPVEMILAASQVTVIVIGDNSSATTQLATHGSITPNRPPRRSYSDPGLRGRIATIETCPFPALRTPRSPAAPILLENLVYNLRLLTRFASFQIVLLHSTSARITA